MQKLYLAAGADWSNVAESIYRRIGLNNPRTAFILTPVEAEKAIGMETWDNSERSALNRVGFNTFDYTITGKKLDQISIELAGTEVLYITGGNECYFREKCDESGFEEFVIDFVKSGKAYIGTSCGAIIAGQSLKPTQKLNDQSQLKYPFNPRGYGLVNYSILPHWGLEEFRDGYINDCFEDMYSLGVPLVALNNYQYIEVIGDQSTIVDVRKEI